MRLGISIRRIAATTARAHMRAAEWFEESATIADLPSGAVYRGAGAPDEVKRDIERRVGAGEIVTLEVVTALIKEHRTRQGKDLIRPKKKTENNKNGQQFRALNPGILYASLEGHETECTAATVKFIELLNANLGVVQMRKALDLLYKTDIISLEVEYNKLLKTVWLYLE